MIYRFNQGIRGEKGRRINFRLLASVLLCSGLFSQYRADRFHHLTVNDGLTQNTIHGIVQDDLGFMWFGSEDGLNKFDGYKVRQFRHVPGDSATIADNFIYSMLKDSRGLIWIGTESGNLVSCNPALESFTNYGNVTHGFPITSMLEYGKYLWLGTEGGGIIAFHAKLRSTHVIEPDGQDLPDPFVEKLFLDSRGRIWIGMHHAGVSVISMNPDSSMSIRTYSHELNDPQSLSWNETSLISEDSDGTIWVGTIKALDRFSEARGTFTHFDFNRPFTDPLSANGMIRLGDNQIILSFQNGGLARFNTEDGRFYSIRHNPGDPASLSYDAVNDIYRDKNGLIWVATWGGGVDWFDPDPAFIHYAYNPDASNSLADPSIRAILQDDQGNLWVGSYGGLDQYNPERQIHRHFSVSPKELSNLNVYSLAYQSPYLWIGTEGGGLDCYHTDSHVFTHFIHKNSSNEGNNFIFSIEQISDRYLCLGSFLGIELYNTETGKFESLQYQNDLFPELKNEQVVALYRDKDGHLWVGTSESGLYRLTIADHTVTGGIHFDKTQNIGLDNNRIKCIYSDRLNRIWIGTHGGGINLFHPENQSFTTLTEGDGLPNNVVYGILEDGDGDLWVSTNKGISHYQTKSNTFVNYTYLNGLQGNEFNTGSHYRAEDGRMYFGGVQGITAFYPKQVKVSEPPFQVRFTDLHLSNQAVSVGEKIFGRVILGEPIFSIRKLELDHRTDQFNIGFSTLRYLDPGLIQYQYKMGGLDQDWSETDGNRPYAIYTHLPPGKYTLQVRAKFVNSTQFGLPAELAIMVLTPFYRTGWAIGFYILVVLGTFAAFINRQLKEQRHELERHQELVKHLQRIDTLKQETIKNQEKYESLYRQSMDAIFICSASGQILDINPAWIKLIGYRKTDLGELNLFDLFTDESQVANLTNAVFKDGFIKDFEVNLTSKDERSIIALITASVIRSRSNEIIRIQGIIRDITVEREAQEEIRRMSHGIESAGELIMMTDLDGTIIYVNPAFYNLTGFTSAEAIGQKPRMLKSGEHPLKFYQEMWAVLLNGEIWDGEIINKKKSGERYMATMTIAPVKDNLGKVVGFVAIQNDITDRILAEDALRKSEANYRFLAQKLLMVQDAERERISRDIHDSLGQYLATLAVHTDLYIDKLKEVVPDISLSMKEAKGLIKDAIEECRRLSFELNPLSLQKLGLVQALNELVRTVEDRSDFKIHFDHPELDERLIPETEVTIYRVVQEALSNIIKHAQAKRVQITLEMDLSEVRLNIVDDGIGLEQSQGRKDEHSISGFGMLNMRERVTQCNGKFDIQSTPQKGVTIQIIIPRNTANV